MALGLLVLLDVPAIEIIVPGLEVLDVGGDHRFLGRVLAEVQAVREGFVHFAKERAEISVLD